MVVLLVLSMFASQSVAKGVTDPFGTRVVSFRTKPVESMNATIKGAGQADWTHDPMFIAMALLIGLGDRNADRRSVLVGFEGDQAESPSSGTVTVRQDRLLDDSTGAVWHQLLMVRGADGVWTVTEHRTACRCQRGANTRDFRAELCP